MQHRSDEGDTGGELLGRPDTNPAARTGYKNSPGLPQDTPHGCNCTQSLPLLGGDLSDNLAARSETLIIATDLQGVVTFFNTGAERVLGYQAAELVGQGAPQLFLPRGEKPLWGVQFQSEPSPAAAGFETIVEQVRRCGNWTGETTLVSKDGVPLPVRLGATVMLDGVGALSGFLCTVKGIPLPRAEKREFVENLE